MGETLQPVTLRFNRSLRVECREDRLTPLVVEPGLASQPTLSRFTAIMSEPGNLQALREDTLELAARGLRAENGGRRGQR